MLALIGRFALVHFCRVTAWIRLQADVIGRCVGPKNWLNYKQPSYL